MKIFINEKLIHLVERSNWHDTEEEATTTQKYDVDSFAVANLQGKVLVDDPELYHLETLIKTIEIRKLKKLDTVFYLVNDLSEAKAFVKALFKIVRASGGLVTQKDKTLMIYRLGCWDLPKGKLNKNEKHSDGAVREVEEECNIKVLLDTKICTTWHTYFQDGKWILKKTSWFTMECIDDSSMAPQAEEGIEDVKWMSDEEVEVALKTSYRSIQEVFSKFREIQNA